MPNYTPEVVRDALKAAIELGRFDLAQDIVSRTGSNLCALCGESVAETETEIIGRDGKPCQAQVCSNCSQ